MADKRLVRSRETFIRRLLARGLFVHEIIALCQSSDLFDDVRSAGSPNHIRFRLLSTKTIRRYIYRVQRYHREQVFDTGGEIAAAHDRLLLVIRDAFATGDRNAIIQAQRVLNKMLGLRRQQEPETIDVEDLQAQVAAMDVSIGLPE